MEYYCVCEQSRPHLTDCSGCGILAAYRHGSIKRWEVYCEYLSGHEYISMVIVVLCSWNLREGTKPSSLSYLLICLFIYYLRCVWKQAYLNRYCY